MTTKQQKVIKQVIEKLDGILSSINYDEVLEVKLSKHRHNSDLKMDFIYCEEVSNPKQYMSIKLNFDRDEKSKFIQEYKDGNFYVYGLKEKITTDDNGRIFKNANADGYWVDDKRTDISFIRNMLEAIAPLQNEVADFEVEKAKFTSEKEAETIKLKEIEQGLADETNSIGILRTELEKRETTVKEFNNNNKVTIKLIESLGLNIRHDNKETEFVDYDKVKFSEVIEKIKDKLKISDAFAKCYLLAVLTARKNGRFLLLTGEVGTGKSRLIKEMGNAQGKDINFIAVRPGWLDASDLLGYFDPLQNKYVETKFTQALRMPTNRSELNIVLLDEMNIARIENYAADVLASLGPVGDRQDIELIVCNDPLVKDAACLVRGYMEQEDVVLPEEIKKLLIKTTGSEFQSKIKLKDNLLICGTLNIDGSTENLSPKMLDRSLILKFPDYDPTKESTSVNVEERSVEITWVEFYSQWYKNFADLFINLSYRVEDDFKVFCSYAIDLDVKLDVNQAFAFARLLPRMQFRGIDKIDNAILFIDKLEQYEDVLCSVKNNLERMKENGHDFISYQHLCG